MGVAVRGGASLACICFSMSLAEGINRRGEGTGRLAVAVSTPSTSSIAAMASLHSVLGVRSSTTTVGSKLDTERRIDLACWPFCFELRTESGRAFFGFRWQGLFARTFSTAALSFDMLLWTFFSC